MRLNLLKRLQLLSLLASVLTLVTGQAYAQIFHRGRADCPPEPCPPSVTPITPAPSTTPPPPASPSVDLSTLAPESSLALGTTTVASDVGYIDSAIPRTLLRLRADSAFNDNRPDRAEFFYAKCGCFRGLSPNNPLFDPKAAGPGTVGE